MSKKNRKPTRKDIKERANLKREGGYLPPEGKIGIDYRKDNRDGLELKYERFDELF